MDSDMRQRNRELSQKKKRLAEIQKRIGELDTIFQRIYEDNIIGKLSDERFMKMSKGYEDEQHKLSTFFIPHQYKLGQFTLENTGFFRLSLLYRKGTRQQP